MNCLRCFTASFGFLSPNKTNSTSCSIFYVLYEAKVLFLMIWLKFSRLALTLVLPFVKSKRLPFSVSYSDTLLLIVASTFLLKGSDFITCEFKRNEDIRPMAILPTVRIWYWLPFGAVSLCHFSQVSLCRFENGNFCWQTRVEFDQIEKVISSCSSASLYLKGASFQVGLLVFLENSEVVISFPWTVSLT